AIPTSAISLHPVCRAIRLHCAVQHRAPASKTAMSTRSNHARCGRRSRSGSESGRPGAQTVYDGREAWHILGRIMNTPNEHLLTGIRVLDFTRALAGPSCSRMFAEMGAEVLKIEAAPKGDLTRAVSKMRADRSFYYVQQNLNKKSLCIDLRKPEGMALVRELVPHCDVVV